MVGIQSRRKKQGAAKKAAPEWLCIFGLISEDVGRDGRGLGIHRREGGGVDIQGAMKREGVRGCGYATGSPNSKVAVAERLFTMKAPV